MNTLQKIIAGTIIAGSTFGSAIFGYNNANAQVAPTKVATETSVVDNKNNTDRKSVV